MRLVLRRAETSATLIRLLAYLGGLALLAMGAAAVFRSPTILLNVAPPSRSAWIEIERPFPAFALAIPEAAGAAPHRALSGGDACPLHNHRTGPIVVIDCNRR